LENKTLIYDKLEAFIKKYYANELLKGLIFFIGLGLLYLLFTLFVEYFLWLKPTGRNHLVLGIHSCRSFSFVPVYNVPDFQVVQTSERN
jgi:hypothetical protein